MQLSRQERRLADKRKRSGKTPYPGATAAIFAELQAAMRHHFAGDLPAAEAGYCGVLAEEPDHPHALNLMGVLACETGRPEAGIDLIRQAIGINGQIAEYHSNLAEALLQLGRLDEASASAQQAVKADRRFARAHLVLGHALRRKGEGQAAISAYRQALALTPEDLEAKTGFARAAVEFGLPPLDAAIEPLVTRAVAESWSRPSDLATCVAATLTREPAVAALLDAAAAEDGAARVAAALADGSLVKALSRPLVRELLASATIGDAAMERLLLRLRRAYLDRVLAGHALSPEAFELLVALATACYLGDYAIAESAEETAALDRLSTNDDSLAVLAAYRPLDREIESPALAALVQLQVKDPAADRAQAVALPELTPMAAGISEQVRAQYEANPYPRWARIGLIAPGLPLPRHLARAFGVPVPDAAEILIAGCGTGQEPIELAMRCRGTPARLLAIDLSRASLAYASRRSALMGLDNLRYAQADILSLDRLDRRFDVITCNGVLHHLADPLAGWRNLVGLLKPTGLMKISLYSEKARGAVVAARALIAERGWPATPEGMRAARAAIFALPADHPARGIMRSPDFYGLNTCRDLIFHVQEHRFTVPRIVAALETLGLKFLAFDVDALSSARYRIRFPDDPSAVNLANWHVFEEENPDTFGAMYHFWTARR